MLGSSTLPACLGKLDYGLPSTSHYSSCVCVSLPLIINTFIQKGLELE